MQSTVVPEPRKIVSRKSGYYDRSVRTKKGGEGKVLKLADKIAVLLIKGTIASRDGARVREEMCRTLMKQFRLDRSRAQRLIDLAKENIHFRCYGRYKRSEIEMNLLISRASGRVGDVTSN